MSANEIKTFKFLAQSSFMVYTFPCMQDDRSLLSDTEEEENCDPEEPSTNPEQVLGL